MRLILYSITSAEDVADTTVNDLSHYRAYIGNVAILQAGTPRVIERGDSQFPFLTGMSLKGVRITLNFTLLSGLGTVGDGFDAIAALFQRPTRPDIKSRTVVFKDADDGNRQWYLTGRAAGVGPHKGGGNVEAYFDIDSENLLTFNTNTESTWTISALPAQNTYTIAVGNVECYPVIDISVAAAGNLGQRYCRFLKTRNYTRNSASFYPIDMTEGGIDTTALVNFTGVSIQINGSSVDNNPATVTIPYDTPVGGAGWTGLALPFLMYRNGEQWRVTARTGGPTYAAGNLTVVRAVNGSVISAHGDNTVIALSKAAFDGRDVRVRAGDGSGILSDIPYWFGTGANAWNQAATKVWINKTYRARAVGTLAAAITDAETSFTLATWEGPIDTTQGILFFATGTEITPYTTYNPATGVVSGLTRAGKDGAAAAHSADEAVYFIDETFLFYGDPLATAPTYNTDPIYLAQKPSHALTSTNSAWTFLVFASNQANTPYEFKPSVNAGVSFTQDASSSTPFVAPAPANPVTDIGVAVIAKNGLSAWYLSVPFKYTSAVCTNVKRLNLPTSRGYLAAADEGTKTLIAATTVVNAWQTTASLTHTPASGLAGTFQLTLYNDTTAAFVRAAAISIASVVINMSTNTTDTTSGRPLVSLGSEQAVDVDVDVTLTNTSITPNEFIRIKFPNLAIGKTLRIDTLNQLITYTKDNSNAFTALQTILPARENWLRFIQGANIITCSQSGLAIIVKEQYRNNTIG